MAQGFIGTPYTPPDPQDAPPVPMIAEGTAVRASVGGSVATFGPPGAGYTWRVYRVTTASGALCRVQLHIGSLSNLAASVVDGQQFSENADAIGYYVPSGQAFLVYFPTGVGAGAETARLEYLETAT